MNKAISSDPKMDSILAKYLKMPAGYHLTCVLFMKIMVLKYKLAAKEYSICQILCYHADIIFGKVNTTPVAENGNNYMLLRIE